MEVVYAVTNSVIPSPLGHSLLIQQGQHWPADDPLVVQRPDLFSPDPRYGLSFSVRPPSLDEPPIEAATAAPGERRPMTPRNMADDAAEELERLRAEATAAGLRFDGRWSMQRLKEELAKVRG